MSEMKYSNYSTVFLTHPIVIETVGSLHKTPLPYRWLTALIAIIPLIILNFVHVDGQSSIPYKHDGQTPTVEKKLTQTFKCSYNTIVVL